MPHIYSLLSQRPGNESILLATIIAAGGSTPQVTGAHAIFNREGLLAGTLGGGIVESEATRKARECLHLKRAAIEEYDLSADVIEGGSAVCGGWVNILFDPVLNSRSVFRKAAEALEQRRPGIFLTKIFNPTGLPVLERCWIPSEELDSQKLGTDIPFYAAGKKPAPGGPLLLKKEEDLWLFAEPLYPAPKLVIAGAGHVGGAVAHLGKLLDFEVTVLDDRPDLAGRITDACDVIVDDISEALRRFPLTEDSYVVIVTRGHKHDADALKACLGRGAAYIGMIGSRRKISLMHKDFLAKKWASQDQLDAVHAPIGLDIGSTTVQEIAVSIAAQLIKVRAKKHINREEKWFGP